MAVDSRGTRGQPHFDGNKAGNTAADENAISDYAAKVGNRIADTAAAREAFSGWDGLLWIETDTLDEYLWTGGQWRLWNRNWAGFTPNIVGVTLGTVGYVQGEYRIRDGIVYMHGVFQLGSNGNVTGGILLSVPISRRNSYTAPNGRATYVDQSNAEYPLWLEFYNDSTVAVYAPQLYNANHLIVVPTSESYPFDAAGSDLLSWAFEYPI